MTTPNTLSTTTETASRARDVFRPSALLANIKISWKLALIFAVMAVGAVGVALTAQQGMQLLRFHLSNIYDFMLIPIVAINQADSSLADASLQLEALKNPALTPEEQAARFKAIDTAEVAAIATIRRYDTEWVTTVSPEFTAVLRDLGRLDLQEDELATLAALHVAYDRYVPIREAYKTSIQSGNPSGQLADEVIKTLTETRHQLKRLIEINNEFADLSNTAAISAYRQALVNMGLALALVVSFALALAYGVTRSITRRLSVVVQAASAQQQGHLEQSAVVSGRDEIATLANAFNSMTAQLRRMMGGLEDQVTARTRDLALAAELGQKLSTLRDLDELLSAAVESIRERFDLYYTQIYLTDATGTSLIMRAGTGAVGESLKQNNFRLPINTGSLNGTAAMERRTVLVEDTTTSPAFRPNPLLPDTRSEMTIPLVVGETVLGVLDVQSDRAGVLTGELIPAFQTLAGQLAVAIENASLFAQAEQARLEVASQARRLTETGWQNFLNAIERSERVGYIYSDGRIQSFTEMAMSPETSPASGALSVPLTVADVPVGEILLHGERQWTDEESDLVNAVAQQVSQQIENLRLLAQAESYRLEAERAARRLTRENWQDYAREMTAGGYAYDLNQVSPLTPEADLTAVPTLKQPLTLRDQVIGELELMGVNSRMDEAAELAMAVANQLTAHIENLRLTRQTQVALSETEEQARRLARLNELGEALSRANMVEDILQVVAAKAGQIIHSDRSSVILLTEAGDYYQTMALSGEAEAEPAPAGTLYLLAGTTAEMAVKQKRLVVVTDPDLNALPNMRRLVERGLRTFMNAPLISGGAVIGTLNAASVHPNAYGSHDENSLLQIASLLASTFENRRLFEQTQHRAKEMAALNNISQALISQQNLNEALKLAGEQIIRNFGADGGYIALYDEQKKQVEYPYFFADGKVAEVPPATLGQDVLSRIIQTRQVLILNRNVAGQMAELGALISGAQAVKSWVGIPILAGKAVLGVISIGVLDREEAFTEDQVRLLNTVAATLSTAIQNARLFEQTQQRSKEMEILNAVGQKLISVSDLKTLLRVVGDTICSNLGADQGYIGLYDATRNRLEFPYYSIDGEVIATPATSLGTGVNALVIQKRQPLLINREIDRRMMNMGAKTMDFSRRPKVWLGVPILAGQDQDPIGLISVQSRMREDAFNEETVRLLTTIAASLSTAIQNIRLFAETQKRANRETLVNAINQKIQSATSVQSAMQVAVEELGRAFKARRTVVQLGMAKPENGHGHQHDDNRHDDDERTPQ